MNHPLLRGRRTLFFGVFVSFLAVVSPTGAQQASDDRNLLKNSNFEAGLDEWKVKKASVATIDPTEKHGPNPFLKIENAAPGDSFVTQKVAVTPNTKYRISAFIKTKDVQAVKRGGKDGASISISGGYKHTPFVNSTKAWTKVDFEHSTGGETEIEIGPRLGMYYGTVTGTAWFSEVKMVAVGKAR